MGIMGLPERVNSLKTLWKLYAALKQFHSLEEPSSPDTGYAGGFDAVVLTFKMLVCAVLLPLMDLSTLYWAMDACGSTANAVCA